MAPTIEQAVVDETVPAAAERARTLVAGLLDCADDQPAFAPIANPEVLLDVVVAERRYQLVCEPRTEAPVSLSSRELEISRMIAAGHTNRTVAAVLEISPWTVSTHLRRVFAKLGVGSRAAMVSQLVTCGLLAPAEHDAPRRPQL